MTKPCIKCGSTERTKRKGRLGDCLACLRERSKKYRINNKDKIREHWDKWEANNLEKVVLAKRAKVKRFRKKYPEKYRAHQKVRYAIRSGKLPKPSDCTCAHCGVPAKEYHHEDYSKPLDVIPICKSCHYKHHDS
jgi:hypothetical protein